MLEKPDLLSPPDFLRFADIQPTAIPCYPLSQLIAEKLHAYTRLHLSGESSRVKDRVDLLLIAGLGEFEAGSLRQAIWATFHARDAHPLPEAILSPPADWEKSFAKIASEIG